MNALDSLDDRKLFMRRIVHVQPLDNGISDEVTLTCGHVIIRICPIATDEAFCADCLHDYLEEQKRK